MGKKCIFLEHSVQIPFVWGEICDVLSVEYNFSGIWIFKSSQDAQGGSLTAAAGPQKSEKFLVVDI